MKKTFSTALMATMALIAANAAYAIPLNYEFNGTVEFSDDGNTFGLLLGDSIFGTLSVEATGEGTEFLTPDLNSLEVFFQVGDVTFSTDQDILYPSFPQLTLTDANVDALDFFAFSDLNLLFTTALSWFAFDESGLSAGGSELTVHQVPEPGTLVLLAMGLTALVIARRRIRARA